jgi:WD repeat and SOF domain-containing protein 1
MHRTQHAVAVASSGYVSIYNLDRQSAAPEKIQWPNSTDTVTDVARESLPALAQA